MATDSVPAVPVAVEPVAPATSPAVVDAPTGPADVIVRTSPPAAPGASPAAPAPAVAGVPLPSAAPGPASSPTTEEVRSAFESKDAATSRAMHQARNAAAAAANASAAGVGKDGAPAGDAAVVVRAAPEKHGGTGSDFIKSIVFGGLDGIVTTFSIMAASSGASLSVQAAITLGFANLLSDGISMGAGDFLSSKAELDFVKSERAREEWEMKNYMEGEIEEMVELYKEKGVADEDARTILNAMAKYPDVFLDHMLQVELGLEAPSPDDSPAKEGFVTFLSFLVFGSVPVWIYLIALGAKYNNRNGIFAIACAATAFTMYLLGMLQGRITRQNVWKAGLLMTFNGGIAAASAYLIGWGLEQGLGTGSSC